MYSQSHHIINDTNQHEMGISDIDVDHNTDESTLSDHDVIKQPSMSSLTMDISTFKAKSSLLNVPTHEKQSMSLICATSDSSLPPFVPSNINEPPTKRRKMDHTLINETNNNNVIEDNINNRQITHSMLNDESINININNQHNNDKNTNVLQSQHLINGMPAFSKVISDQKHKFNTSMIKVIKLREKCEAVRQTVYDHINAVNKHVDELQNLNEEVIETGILNHYFKVIICVLVFHVGIYM